MPSERLRPEIAKARDLWINRRMPFFRKALSHLIFIDETSTNAKLTKRTGWSRKGRRYYSYCPFSRLEDPDVYCRSQMSWFGRLMDRQRTDEPA